MQFKRRQDAYNKMADLQYKEIIQQMMSYSNANPSIERYTTMLEECIDVEGNDMNRTNSNEYLNDSYSNRNSSELMEETREQYRIQLEKENQKDSEIRKSAVYSSLKEETQFLVKKTKQSFSVYQNNFSSEEDSIKPMNDDSCKKYNHYSV